MRVTDSIRRGKSVLTSSIGTEAVCCQAAVKNLMVHSSPSPMSVRKKTNTIFFFRVKDNRTEPSIKASEKTDTNDPSARPLTVGKIGNHEIA